LDKDQVGLVAAAQITPTPAQKIIDKLHSLDSLEPILALEYACYPADTPVIEFRKDAKEYAPLNELSVGQKCTALLIIALSQGTRPVIIDQPEDALDIRTVWEDISMKLRKTKDLRQFVLTSHNATVVVSSDSDTYAVVTGSASKGKVTCLGGIESPAVKKAVIQHLEGGSEPYRLRTNKYNLSSSNR
jgi:ABC-type multidrug transport system ATPase subunit